jgi:hypothetical protein
MVCKECGSYNAENLSICKECGAKLRDDDTAATSEQVTTGDEGRPSRDFVKPPAWPKSAFAGAPEKPVSSAAGETPASASAFRPTIPPRAAASAPVPTCPHCGKPVLSDAPFCAYCGQRLAGEAPAASAPVSARPAAKPAPAQPQRATYAANDYDDEDEYDDEEDEEDYKPAKGSKRPAKIARRAKDDLDEYDEEDEEEYDEEYDDDMPQKRGKGTTILFWGLIALLLALIAVFGMYIAKKNFDGDVGKMFASIGTIFNKGKSDDVNADDPSATTDPASQMYTATITESTDPQTNDVWYDIDISAPTGSTIRVITDATLTQDTVKVPTNDRVRIHIARDVFMPNAPVDSETVTLQPNIQAISPDGQTMQVAVPPITVTVPALSMTITEPVGDSVNATFDNSPIAIIGQVNNYDGEIAVFVNDQQVYVDSTGLFTASFTPEPTAAALALPTSTPVASTDPTTTPDPAASTSPEASTAPDATAEGTEATEEPVSEETAAAEAIDTAANSAGSIVIEARKKNCVTARQVITVQPYVMQTMSFTINNELKSLSSDTGSVTITGTCTPGAAITATSTSPDVTFGEATVTETGTFTLIATIAKVGGYDVSLVGKLQGYYDGTAITIVERPPSGSSSAFKKAAADISKNMDKIKSGAITSGDFVVTGKITEIIAAEPYTIFRVQISEGNEVIVYNRSAKSTINTSDVKKKKQIAGTLKGLYTDGATPVLWGWFVWNK